jgi:tetratricopeptide (TPR) repeat protein
MPGDRQPDEEARRLLDDGRRRRRLGEYDAAIAAFTSASLRWPEAARPLCERGAILILQRKYAEALADYQAAQQFDPGYPGLRSYLAELYLYTGRAAEALALSRQALLDEPGDLMHDINIAHAHLLLGHTAEALECYARLGGRYHPRKERYGRDLVLEDLRLLQAAGVQVPQAGLVPAALGGPFSTR